MPEGDVKPIKELETNHSRTELKTSPKGALNYLKKTGQIALLTVVLSTACNSAEKAVNKIPTEPNPNTPIAEETIIAMPTLTHESTSIRESVIVEPQIAAEKISRIIKESNAPQDQKDQLTAQFTEQEQARKSLVLLEHAYNAEKTDGIPTLLVQTKKMFGKMDLKPLWEGEYPTEKAYLESQIFFLHDLQEINNTFLTAANLPDANFVDIQTLIQHLPVEIRAQFETYAKMNTQKESTITFGKIQSTNPEDIANNQQEQARLEEQINKLPLISNISISFGNISNGDFNVITGEATLGANNNPVDLVNHVVIGHGQDIYDNYAILESLSPKDIIRIMVARNNAVLDPQVGIRYMDPEKIYSPTAREAFLKFNAHKPLNLEEFGFLISDYPQNYFLGFADRNNPNSNPFTKILESPTLNKLSSGEITATTPIIDKTFAGFLEKESTNLTNIEKENKLTGMLLKRIIEKQNTYKQRFGEDVANTNPNFGFTEIETYKTITSELLIQEATSAIFKNDQEVLALIPPEQLKSLLQNIVTLTMATNREQQAVGIEWTLNTPGLSLTETSNPYQTYLDLLWEIKNSQN